MLIRMISNISRWDGTNKVNRHDASICGDAIADLRTTENRLSVWRANSEEDIDDDIVALALNRDAVSKLSYVLLKEEALAELEIDIADDKLGNASGLENTILEKHRDLIEIDYIRLGFLADYMTKLVRDDMTCVVKSKNDVKNLLNKYKNENKIEIDRVKPSLKQDLKW